MRYFYITFSHDKGDGHLIHESDNYPSLKKLIKIVNETDPELNNITLLNIIELNQEDYDSFINQ